MDLEKVEMRYSSIDDEKFLKKCLEDKQNLKWFPFSTEQEVAQSIKNWIGYSKFYASLTATIDKKPVAVATLFLMPYKKVSHHCMFYLLVDSEYQNKGLESMMIKNIKNLAKSYFYLESITVEIFEGCPMYKIFLENGFETYAKQKYFIEDEGRFSSRILLECFF